MLKILGYVYKKTIKMVKYGGVGELDRWRIRTGGKLFNKYVFICF